MTCLHTKNTDLGGVTTNVTGTLLRTAVVPVANQQVSGGRDVV